MRSIAVLEVPRRVKGKVSPAALVMSSIVTNSDCGKQIEAAIPDNVPTQANLEPQVDLDALSDRLAPKIAQQLFTQMKAQQQPLAAAGDHHHHHAAEPGAGFFNRLGKKLSGGDTPVAATKMFIHIAIHFVIDSILHALFSFIMKKVFKKKKALHHHGHSRSEDEESSDSE